MDYETYREHLNDVAVKIDEYKRHIAEYEMMINNAIEYINGYKVAGEVNITCFNKTTGREENVGKDLLKILSGIRGINKILEVNDDMRIFEEACDVLNETFGETIDINDLIALIELQTIKINNLKEDLIDAKHFADSLMRG